MNFLFLITLELESELISKKEKLVVDKRKVLKTKEQLYKYLYSREGQQMSNVHFVVKGEDSTLLN